MELFGGTHGLKKPLRNLGTSKTNLTLLLAHPLSQWAFFSQLTVQKGKESSKKRRGEENKQKRNWKDSNFWNTQKITIFRASPSHQNSPTSKKHKSCRVLSTVRNPLHGDCTSLRLCKLLHTQLGSWGLKGGEEIALEETSDQQKLKATWIFGVLLKWRLTATAGAKTDKWKHLSRDVLKKSFHVNDGRLNQGLKFQKNCQLVLFVLVSCLLFCCTALSALCTKFGRISGRRWWM